MDQVLDMGGMTTLVHFTYCLPDTDEEWRIACMPNAIEFCQTQYHPNYQRTNDVRAVNCLACEQTPIFKKHKDELDNALRRLE